MRAAKTFEKARTAGDNLHLDEARVAAVPQTPLGRGVWLGLDQHDTPVAYFEVPGRPDVAFAVSQLIEVSTVRILLGGTSHERTAIKIICRDAALVQVFTTFIEDVIGELTEGTDVPRLIVKSAARWRRLLQIAGRGFSANAAAGLYGELRFLEQAIQAAGPDAMQTWQRQQHDAHDFSGTGMCVEVKTTGMQSKASVAVHGLQQLLPCRPAPLALAVAEVVLSGGGERIDNVVDRILATGVDPDSFASKLAGEGYVQGMPSAMEFTFELRRWRFWTIDEASPVLTAARLDEDIFLALANVSYDLVLAALGDGDADFDFQRLTHKDTGLEI